MAVSQTWLIGNTASDVLIAAAMLYHVNPFMSRVNHGSFRAHHLASILQLALRRTKDGSLSNHALVRIVRLTVETNILTSKYLPSP